MFARGAAPTATASSSEAPAEILRLEVQAAIRLLLDELDDQPSKKLGVDRPAAASA